MKGKRGEGQGDPRVTSRQPDVDLVVVLLSIVTADGLTCQRGHGVHAIAVKNSNKTNKNISVKQEAGLNSGLTAHELK